MPAKTAKTRRKKPQEDTEELRQVLLKAIKFCLFNYPMLWTVGGEPEKRIQPDGPNHWIVHVYLRYPTGHDGYLGDLYYDGQDFKELTDREVMKARAQEIAADPERLRAWNEYRASTSQADEG